MKKLIYSTMIAVMLLMACSTTIPPEVQKQLTKFKMPIEKDGEVWGRAIEYVSKIPYMKISTQTNNLIESYSTTSQFVYNTITFKVSKIIYKDSVEYTVDETGYSVEKAKLCAYYMRTGKMID